MIKRKNPDKKVDISKLDSDSPYFPTLKNLFSSGHIDEATFIETTKKLDSSKTYLLYCDKGVLSQLHGQYLKDEGKYTNIKVFRP